MSYHLFDVNLNSRFPLIPTEQPPFNPGQHQMVVTEPLVADRIKLRLIRARAKKYSLCLRAEIYGCEVPRGLKFIVIFFISINH